MKILVADDNATNAKLMRAVLEAEGHEVLVAKDGQEAWETLKVEQVDIVVSDILMPRMDGFRLCQHIRADKRIKDLPFIIYTATYTSSSDEKLAKSLGTDVFLLKPAPTNQLLTAIEQAAQIKQRDTSTYLDEPETLREYNERLISKLEEKVLQLAASNEQIKLQGTALETAANSILITDAHGVIQWVNPAFSALTGYTAYEVLGRTPRILKSGVQDEAFYAEFWDTILAGKTWTGEFINRRKNGTFYIDEHTVTPVLDIDGNVTHFVGIMHDVTDRRHAEEELRRTHRQLQHLLAHSPAVLYSISVDDGLFTPSMISDNIERLMGIPPGEASFEWWKDSIHPDDHQQVLDNLAVLTQGDGYSHEYRLRHKDGSYKWIQDTNRVIRDKADGPFEIVGVWTDISQRKQTEEALQTSQEQFRELLENVELIAVTLDTEGRVTFCNDFLLNLTGWKRDDVLGKDWFKNFVPSELQTSRKNLFFESLPDGKIRSHMEGPITTKSGVIRDIVWNNTMLKDASGVVTGTASIGEDVTDRNRDAAILKQTLDELERRVEERTSALAQSNLELQVAKELADIANHAKSEFLSRMSHELRTPMNAILGFGQLMELSKLDSDQRDSLQHILKAGRHLLGLIDDILEIARIDIGTLGISLEPVDVNEVIKECADLMRPLADERGVELINEATQPTFATADRQRLRQVLMNLVSNAVKYNSKGGEVRIRVVERDPNTIAIEVADTGFGIPEPMLERMFTPFDRLGVESRGIEGTGLGLSLSKSLTLAMDGTLSVESKEGVGSTFRVELRKGEPMVGSAIPAVKSIDSLTPDTQKRRLLIIEDNLTNAELLRRVFEHRPHFELLTAMQGRLGLDLAEEHHPDVILLDLHLPDMQGREVLQAIRGNPSLASTPVIIISADAFKRQADLMIKLGAFRYITKPFQIDDLLRAVDEAITSRGTNG